ncbi:MAG TPA: DivIVA domain-containing protein, partial [Clostridia bacterium]|nr:DivIVA domain-containing protein [Clostridia bacterium]
VLSSIYSGEGAGQPMKNRFKMSLFGYSKNQVNHYVLCLRKDYEEELRKKKDRMLELNEENRELKGLLSEYEEKLFKYKEQELFISKALIKAEENAQLVMEKCHHNRQIIEQKTAEEQEKWKVREEEIRKGLLDYQNKAYLLMDNIQAEINYLATKELINEMKDKSFDEKDKDDDMLSANAM